MSGERTAKAASRASVDEAAFRATMRRLAAGVTVVTSRHGARLNGMTATAVCSVSADPPLVLVVVNRSNASHELITQGRAFALNFLSADQSELASLFAKRGDKPFDTIPHRLGKTGCPLLEGCTALVECELETLHDVATHTVFIGRVIDNETSECAPLTYHDARFWALQALNQQR
ncbi:flavin reductase family protein [Ancylobacter rudongensis]|uniref:NADH-FMN oxidoreductase RutF, flavin reductase (DIM6/NTAB) family n=1 Tax=Ancylobacter rudongensis TaxID=177413 RepID=A0A1G4SBQ5_9HYPH|nr:flavin reductase family protein [Ancylobacter rudongensis]SCW66624.1 NADH-FMN oxidoreductase RutF, flavin reductase (DIM6/NTAB) family [Ancylobacter rudongensis]